MGLINHVASHVTGTNLVGVSTLEIVWVNGVAKLYVGSQQSGGISVYTLGSGPVVFQEQIGYAPNRGTAGLSDIDIITVNGTNILVPSGRFDDRTAFHQIGADGGFDAVTILGASATLIGNLQDTVTFQVQGKTFMISAQWGQSGFEAYQIRDDLTLEHIISWGDTAATHAGDIAALGSATVAGRSYVFAASGLDAGVTSYWMGQYGNLKVRGSIGADDGLGISAPTCLQTASVDGKLYLLLGSAGSGSISVLRVNTWGSFFEVDTYLDNLNTRFGGIQALETFQIGNRAFVVAGGADDGISLFELQPGGTLFHLDTIADQTNTTLQDISAIAVQVVGTTVHLFVSGGETGITQFTIDLGVLANFQSGTDLADSLTGTTGHDLLSGKDGNDILNGGAGNDRIIDGAGSDTLTGSSGMDVFIFVSDGRLDGITDFVRSQDRIDLSAWDRIYDISQLTITQKDYGVMIEFDGERLKVEGPGAVLQVAQLTNAHFIFDL